MIEWIRGEWWWHISRHCNMDSLRWKLAWMIPRKIALYVFVRVYSATSDIPGPDYERCYKGWELGAGK